MIQKVTDVNVVLSL